MGKHKDDDVDAEHMTSLIHDSKFPVAYEYPESMRAARDLFRRRMFFINKRAGALTHIQNTFYQHGLIESLQSDLRRKKDRNEVLKRMPDTTTRESLHADLKIIDTLDAIIKDLGSKALDIAKQHDLNALQILQSMPGLGPFLSLTILYEIHTIERFASVQNFSSYARTVKARCISSNKTVGAGEDKIGNPTLNWAFTEIAMHIGAYDSFIKLWYDRLKRRKGLKCARSTLIHKIAVTIFYMLKRKEPFDVNKFLAGNTISRTDNPKGPLEDNNVKPPTLIGTPCAFHSKATKNVRKTVTSKRKEMEMI